MKATIELEIDILMDSVPAIVAGLHAAADKLQGCMTIRRGLGTYFIDQQGNDIGCLAPWAGARDMTLEAA